MVGARSNHAGITAIGLGACALSLSLVFAGCASSGAGSAQSSADSTTKSVYNDDVAGVTQNFDDGLKAQVTRSEVGIMSDQMHQLGDYKGLTFVNSDPNKNEYTYRADFTKGSGNVVVRLDSDGRFAAYRFLVPK
jgi:hypothetical protein